MPSFARWPLRLHVFVPEVLSTWEKWCSTADEPMPDTFELCTDFGPTNTPSTATEGPATGEAPWGIHALPLDYMPLRDYVDKAHDIFMFEREGSCAVCDERMPPGEGLYAVCPNTACEAVGHLRCWGQHVLQGEANGESERDGILVPVRGTCPKCGGEVAWSDMMKELTLRLRAPKEVDKLVKAKRRLEKVAAAAAKAAAKAADKAERPATAETDKSPKKATAAARAKRTGRAGKEAKETPPKTTAGRRSKAASAPEVIVLEGDDE